MSLKTKSESLSMASSGAVTSIKGKKPSLSAAVIICTHNRPVVLERCLQGLQQVNDPRFSLFVVDSAPETSKTKSLAARYGAQYCLSPLKGLSRARNIGARA